MTNRHVVQIDYRNEKYKGYKLVELKIESNYRDNITNKCETRKEIVIKNYNSFVFSKNENDDVACLFGIDGSKQNIGIKEAVDYSMLADDKWINEKLCVCDLIAIPGFPNRFDKNNNAPIMRSGTIASDPRLDYSGAENDTIISKRIAYEGYSKNGASGSPVFVLQKGFATDKGLSTPEDFYREVKLVGINALHYTDTEIIEENEKGEKIGYFEHSGISIFYKSSIIKEMIDLYFNTNKISNI